ALAQPTPLETPGDPSMLPQLASYANSWDDPTMIALPGTGVFGFDGQSWVVQGTSPATALASGIFAGNRAAYGLANLADSFGDGEQIPRAGKIIWPSQCVTQPSRPKATI
ncbi:MAG: hypothetical protein ACREE6_18750, partial [Limisphaerales bacterium]